MSMIIPSDIDCGNAPKMEILRQLCIAFAEGNIASGQEWLSEDVVWELVGSKSLGGLEAVVHHLSSVDQKVASLSLKHVMSHGDVGCIDGTFETESGQTFAFSNVYEFTGHNKSAKVNHISSYVIGLD